jgi:hypothetical protein
MNPPSFGVPPFSQLVRGSRTDTSVTLLLGARRGTGQDKSLTFISPDWEDRSFNFRRQNVKRTHAVRIKNEKDFWTRTKSLKHQIYRHLTKAEKDFVIALRGLVRLIPISRSTA